MELYQQGLITEGDSQMCDLLNKKFWSFFFFFVSTEVYCCIEQDSIGRGNLRNIFNNNDKNYPDEN